MDPFIGKVCKGDHGAIGLVTGRKNGFYFGEDVDGGKHWRCKLPTVVAPSLEMWHDAQKSLQRMLDTIEIAVDQPTDPKETSGESRQSADEAMQKLFTCSELKGSSPSK